MDIRFIIERLLIIEIVTLLALFFIFIKAGLIFGRFSLGLSKGLITAGMKQHIATLSTFIYTRVNQLIVFRYCGESETGFFSVALNLAFALIFIPETFRTALYPRVIHSDDDYDVTVRALRIGFYVWGGIVIFTILLARPLLLMYGGDKFLPSVNTFRILMIAGWFLPLSSLFAPYCAKKGAFGIASFLAAVLGIIGIGINLLLVPRYASRGAALSTALVCLIGFGKTIIFMHYLSKKNPLVIFMPDFKKEINFIRQLYFKKRL
jgi:O-antigen/teichoic acid export membrane protein